MDTEISKTKKQAASSDGTAEDKKLSEHLSKQEEELQSVQKTISKLEEDSMMLRELFTNANNELNNMKKPALLVADIVQMHQDKAVIKLPNGNKFYCYVSKEIKGLRPDDVVLVDQKTLNVVQKIDLGNNYDVEKFV